MTAARSDIAQEGVLLPDAWFDSSLQGQNLGGAATWAQLLNETLGGVPTLLVLVRHFG